MSKVKKKYKKNLFNRVKKNASLVYNKRIDIYKKEYHIDEVKKEKEDETDKKLPAWIKVPKSRFNEIKDVITRSNESRLMTSTGKTKITLKNVEKLLEGIISGKIDTKEARKMYNSISDDANELNRLEITEPRKKVLPIFK